MDATDRGPACRPRTKTYIILRAGVCIGLDVVAEQNLRQEQLEQMVGHESARTVLKSVNQCQNEKSFSPLDPSTYQA